MSNSKSDFEEMLHARAELQSSLRACQELVADLRSKLAANGNEPPSDNDREDEGKDQSSG